MWEVYSARCQAQMDNRDVLRIMLEKNGEGRNPQITSVTAKVNGSSGQVVTVDADPAAPASSMQPRTWTFIDGAWRFDSC
ncbi:hypothetical protein GCM10027089_36430 [Nocardia thraciensis]